MDILKYLPIGNNWNEVMDDANEVQVIVSYINCIERSLNRCHSLIDNQFSHLQSPFSYEMYNSFLLQC